MTIRCRVPMCVLTNKGTFDGGASARGGPEHGWVPTLYPLYRWLSDRRVTLR